MTRNSLCAQGGQVFLDVPEVNAAAVDLAAKYQMTKVFETARMYKGLAPTLPLDKKVINRPGFLPKNLKGSGKSPLKFY